MGVSPDRREIRRGNRHRAAQPSTRSKARKIPHVGLPTCHVRHQDFTEMGGEDDPRSTNPPQLPRRERIANPRTKRESSALPLIVTSGATVALSNSQDQCSNAALDGAADIASAPPEPSSHLVSSPVTGWHRTRPMEGNRCGSMKKVRVTMRSLQERLSSAPT